MREGSECYLEEEEEVVVHRNRRIKILFLHDTLFSKGLGRNWRFVRILSVLSFHIRS